VNRGQVVPRGEYAYETVAIRFRLERMREVIAREPELEAWALGERFGLTTHQARIVRWYLLRGLVQRGARWLKP